MCNLNLFEVFCCHYNNPLNMLPVNGNVKKDSKVK